MGRIECSVKGSEAQSVYRILQVHEDDVHVRRGDDANQRVPEDARGHNRRPEANIAL